MTRSLLILGACATLLAADAASCSAQNATQDDERLRSVALLAHALDGRRQLPGATMATIDSLLALYAEEVVYEHPSVGAVVRGTPALRAGMSRFLGSRPAIDTTTPRVTIGARVAVLELAAGPDPRRPTDPVPSTRRAIRVLEFDAQARIVRVLDYPW